MEKRKAIVFGGTGLVGRQLVSELNSSDNYSSVRVLLRKPAFFTGDKINEMIFNFENPGLTADMIGGDDLFICIGTTIRKAGSVKRVEEIDRDLPLKIAEIAANNGVKRIAVVSSIGAGENSSNYYLRIKGEMEKGILGSGIGTVAIVRPSILFGEREEKRFGESAGKLFMSAFGFLLTGRFKKYRGIYAGEVAKAMVRIMKEAIPGKRIYESDELKEISRK